MDIDPWIMRLYVPKQLFIPVEGQLGIQTALHQDLITAEFDRLSNLVQQDRAIEDVGVGRADFSIKRAKVAIGGANVCVVNITVDIERPIRLGMEPFRNEIGGAADGEQVV
mgnify:CR=1 FL=1